MVQCPEGNCTLDELNCTSYGKQLHWLEVLSTYEWGPVGHTTFKKHTPTSTLTTLAPWAHMHLTECCTNTGVSPKA